MKFPSRVLLAPQNRLFVADSGDHTIREIALDHDGRSGQVVRRFGSGEQGLDDGSAEAARFNEPRGMSYWRGTLYVCDSGNHVVRAIDLARGVVRTVAGTGERATGRVVAGGQALFTPLRSPHAVWAENESVLLVALAGSHQIAVVLDESVIGPFAGNGVRAVVDGGRAEASFEDPVDLAEGLDHLFIADAAANMIRAVSLGEEPVVSSLAGQPEPGDVDGSGPEARLRGPSGVAFHEGLLYVADTGNHRIKRIDPTTATCESVIGTGRPGTADGGFAECELHDPEGLAIESGLLYIADRGNAAVRVADLARGIVHTLRIDG